MKGKADIVSKFGGIKIGENWYNASTKEFGKLVAENWRMYKDKNIELVLDEKGHFTNINILDVGTPDFKEPINPSMVKEGNNNRISRTLLTSETSIRQTAAHCAARMLAGVMGATYEEWESLATRIEAHIMRENQQ